MRTPTRDKSWRADNRDPPNTVQRTIRTEHEIGPKRAMMRNGNLVCFDVPIARTGWMLYGPGQVPVQTSPTSAGVYVERTADELFADDTLASFEGAAVTLGHPSFDEYPNGVTPDNYEKLAHGFATNVRPGTGDDSDVMLADLVITRRPLIKEIMSGKREVSAGYDASYQTVQPGIGLQRNIIGNHIALVEKGRCGPRCAIGDQAINQPQELHMAADKTGGQRRRFSPEELDTVENFVSDARRRLTGDEGDDDQGIHVHVHTGATHDGADPAKKKKVDDDDELDTRLSKVEKMCADIGTAVTTMAASMQAFMSGGSKQTADADTDAATKAAAAAAAGEGDSKALATSFTDFCAKAEVLVPGFAMPTFDAAAPRKLTVESMCAARGRVLDLFASTADGKAIVTQLTGDAAPNFADMDCAQKAVLFNAAHGMKATANNKAATQDASHAGKGALSASNVGARVVDMNAINERNKKYWANNAQSA